MLLLNVAVAIAMSGERALEPDAHAGLLDDGTTTPPSFAERDCALACPQPLGLRPNVALLDA